MRLGPLGVRPLRQVEVVERAVEGRPLLRGELRVGHVGEGGRPPRPGPPAPGPTGGGRRSARAPSAEGPRASWPPPAAPAGPGRVAAFSSAGSDSGPRCGGRRDTAVPRTMPGALLVADHLEERSLRGGLEGPSRVQGGGPVRPLLLPAGYHRRTARAAHSRRAVAVAVVAGVRGVLPPEGDGQVRPRGAEGVVVPRVHDHVRLGPHVAGHARGALAALPVEVVPAASRSARAGGTRSRRRLARPSPSGRGRRGSPSR